MKCNIALTLISPHLYFIVYQNSYEIRYLEWPWQHHLWEFQWNHEKQSREHRECRLCVPKCHRGAHVLSWTWVIELSNSQDWLLCREMKETKF